MLWKSANILPPGSVLLLTGFRNEPLGLRNAPARTSTSSLPSPYPTLRSRKPSTVVEKKKTKDGAIILDPQPDDSHNDPLNWATWRRDSALLSLGFYCMVGGGMTPILAAGFTNVAHDYNVTVPQVALTTGLYMLGLGIGSVIASPTAILYGKRPVYLASGILFIVASIWCALSPNYTSLVVARIFQGISVSPVECLPSATIAEIFFLHERAYRLGIYTLLLLGGKNLIPLVSAVIIQALSWRWVFWIVAMVVGFCWVLLFLFVPETFWDRTPRPKRRTSHDGSRDRLHSIFSHHGRRSSTSHHDEPAHTADASKTVVSPGADGNEPTDPITRVTTKRRASKALHVGFAELPDEPKESDAAASNHDIEKAAPQIPPFEGIGPHHEAAASTPAKLPSLPCPSLAKRFLPLNELSTVPTQVDGAFEPSPLAFPASLSRRNPLDSPASATRRNPLETTQTTSNTSNTAANADDTAVPRPGMMRYTTYLKTAPRRTFAQELRPWNGRLHSDNWFRVAIRPLILLSHPAVLWSSVIYACSVGWLIVLSESVSTIYRGADTYNFTALQTGLVYLSPFIGGVLGTAVAGKVSDVVVRAMARRNGGLYEPEFRLVMALPIALSTGAGLMGFGWAAEEKDAWIVPTIFFGIISFGCSLGSTTSITFCVDSYRVYAGEALVTLNFCKNVLHGLVFSLFFVNWLEAQGSKRVFLALGGIQLAACATALPMYVWGKRARMWTARRRLMEKF
jgi:hypothetical protein